MFPFIRSINDWMEDYWIRTKQKLTGFCF